MTQETTVEAVVQDRSHVSFFHKFNSWEFDEMGISPALLPLATSLSNTANPNHVHAEFVSHGYGIVDASGYIVAELWYSDILNQTNVESFSEGYFVLNGMNHWERSTLSTPSASKDTLYLLSNRDILSIV